MSYSLAAKLGICKEAGNHIRVSVDDGHTYVVGALALTNQCICTPFCVDMTQI
jgi:hypothetical protein